MDTFAKKISKFYFLAFIALSLVILSVPFFWPAITQPLMWIVIIAGTAGSIVITVDRHYRKYLQGNRNFYKLLRNAGVDVFGILLTIGCAIWLAGDIVGKVVPAVANAFELLHPGIGFITGIIAGLICALIIGLVVGLVIRWVWGKLMARLN